MVDYGLRDLGYEYIILDDCWSNTERSPNGSLVANATKFPNGMGYVADQIHSKGMKFGMYSSAGMYTCAQYRKYKKSLFGLFEYLMLPCSCFSWPRVAGCGNICKLGCW